MSDTPRTNAEIYKHLDGTSSDIVDAKFTRQLERELDVCRIELDKATKGVVSQGLTLVTLCDMVLGEDAENRTDDNLVHAVRKLLNERDEWKKCTDKFADACKNYYSFNSLKEAHAAYNKLATKE